MNTEEQKPKKIDLAINDTKLRLEDTKLKIMLLTRERDTLQTQLNTLEIIRDDNKGE